MKRKIVILGLAMLMIGCVTTGRKIDQVAADSIKTGVTTRADVGRILGSPEMVTKKSNGDVVYIYTYARVTPKASTFIPYVGMFMGGANVQSQTTNVTFGPDGVVKDCSTSQGATESGYGLAAGGAASVPEVEGNKRAE
jgi:outer membrane protein assembly factor BamE (lipoprotein component of BamABCDE complex)